MSKAQEYIKSIKEQKIQFANDFIDAIDTQNIDMCKNLTLSFSDYKKLYSHSQFSQEKYENFICELWREFFKKYQYFFDDNKKILQNKGINSCTIYDLGDKEEIVDDFHKSSIAYILLKMKGETLDDGKISSLVFEIDNPVVINGKIKFSYQINMQVYESIEENPNIIKNYVKQGFKALSSEQYLEIMKEASFDDYNYYSGYNWAIYDGSLNISSKEFKELEDDIGYIINGNLIVDGVLDISSKMLCVLGSVKTKSIFIIGSLCHIEKVAHFDDVLIIDMGDGQPVSINDTKGRLVYNRLDSTEMVVEKEKVDVCLDLSYDNSFGDIAELLKDKFLEDEGDYYMVDTYELLEATLNGDSIFKKLN
jgi:hypothetical protein